MKKNLQEQITRMHKLAYGKEVILENSFWDFLSGKDEDDPKQADLVEPDVQALYDNLSEAAATGLNQQEQGHMNYQKEVESMQIGLQLLGYDLPRFGVDGKFGPETAAAVRKFKEDNMGSDVVNEAFVKINSTNYSNVKVDNDSQYDQVNDALLDDLQKAGEAAGVVATITTASTGHSKLTTTGNESRHGFGTAVDIAILNNVSYGDPNFKQFGDKLKDALVSMGYTWNTESGNEKAVLWQTSTGGNHYNHLHVSNKGGVSGNVSMQNEGGMETATPEMLNELMDLLKKKILNPAI